MAQDQDTQAFDELIRRYSGKLYAMVYHMTSNSEDAYDLVQEIFTKAYHALGKFQGKSTFYTWIYTIATNRTLNFLKKRNRQAALSLDDLDAGFENDEAMVDVCYQVNPRHQSEVNELQKKLNEAMQKLSEQHRAVVVMFDIQGLPHAQISEILKVSEGTVRSRLHYAHQQLQSYLQEYID